MKTFQDKQKMLAYLKKNPSKHVKYTGKEKVPTSLNVVDRQISQFTTKETTVCGFSVKSITDVNYTRWLVGEVVLSFLDAEVQCILLDKDTDAAQFVQVVRNKKQRLVIVYPHGNFGVDKSIVKNADLIVIDDDVVTLMKCKTQKVAGTAVDKLFRIASTFHMYGERNALVVPEKSDFFSPSLLEFISQTMKKNNPCSLGVVKFNSQTFVKDIFNVN